jgi:lysophospholipase L1-like esterase
MTVRFKGVSATAILVDQFLHGRKNYYAGSVDGGEPIRIVPDFDRLDNRYPIATGLPYGEHTLSIVKKTDSALGFGRFLGVEIHGEILPPPERPARRIEIIGDSFSVGAGNEAPNGDVLCGDAHWDGSTDASRSYGMLLGKKLDAEVHVSAVSGRGLVRNYSPRDDARPLPEVYGLTFMEQTNSVEWDTNRFVPDAVLLALGTNDFSPGDGSEPAREKMTVERFTQSYVTFIEALRGYYPDAHFFLLSSPMLGDGWPDSSYRSATDLEASLTAVESHFHEIADSKITKFFVTRRAGRGCGAHPDLEQHEEMAEELVPVLREALGW